MVSPCSCSHLVQFSSLPFTFQVQFSSPILLVPFVVLLFLVSYFFVYLQSFLIHVWKYELVISPFFVYYCTCLCSSFHLLQLCSGLVSSIKSQNCFVFSTQLWFDYFFFHFSIAHITFSLSSSCWCVSKCVCECGCVCMFDLIKSQSICTCIHFCHPKGSVFQFGSL